jgi:hypothetical protein
MAKGTKQFAQESFTGLPGWAKGAIAVGVLAGVGYAVYYFTKQVGEVKEGKTERIEDRGWNSEFDKLNSNDKTKATLSKAELLSLANKIHAAMDGYGTDEEAIVKSFRSLKNNADFAGLQAAYGIQEISSGRFNPEPNFKGNMIATLSTELSDYWVSKINAILKAKGIKYKI